MTFKSVMLALSVVLALMLSACFSLPQPDLNTLLQMESEAETIPSALLVRCKDELPIPAEILAEDEMSPAQSLGLSLSWAGEYHYCRGRHDVLIDYVMERRGG
jgi:hypothetical protein